MPKTTKTKKKVIKSKTKKVNKSKIAIKTPIKISKSYVPKESEKYMCEKHKVFFRMKLQEWRKELIKANNEALYNGSMDDNSISADIATYPWIARHNWHDIGLINFKNLTRWYEEISERDAVKKGFAFMDKNELPPRP